MLTQAGCLLGEAPEYQSRRQTPPVVLTTTADPSLNRVIPGRMDETQEFKVLYRSEDAGDSVTAILFRDFHADNTIPQILKNIEIAPSSNLYPDEGEPSQALIPYSFVNADLGCHSYTMMLTHSGNLNVASPRNEDDVALVTWWAKVVNQSGEPADVLVDQCGADDQ